MGEANVEALARHLASEYVYDWVVSDSWFGYPSGPEQEREAEDEYMPRAREKARSLLEIAGIEVDD